MAIAEGGANATVANRHILHTLFNETTNSQIL